AVILGRDLLQLVFGVQGRDVCRARHGVRGLASAGWAGPRKIAASVAPRDLTFVPRYAQDFRRDAMAIADRFGAQIADTGLNVDLAIRLDHEQSIESNRAADEAAGGHSDATRLGAAALGLRFAFVPTEGILAFIERFFNECAGGVKPFAVGQRRSDR